MTNPCVKVHMSRDDVFSFQLERTFVARLVSAPSGAGDTFHLRVPLPAGPDREIYLNGNSADFIGMEVLKA